MSEKNVNPYDFMLYPENRTISNVINTDNIPGFKSPLGTITAEQAKQLFNKYGILIV